MNIKANRDHLYAGLKQVLSGVTNRASMPILTNVLIEANSEENYLLLTTTNLDIAIQCKISVEVIESGVITLPAMRLANIVRLLPVNLMELVTKSNYQANITSGGSSFKIMGMDSVDFPKIPTFDEKNCITINQSDLLSMIKNVSYAQSEDETRHIMNGVCFHFDDGKLTLTATDGKRLAISSKELSIDNSINTQVVIPERTISELERALGKGEKVTIKFNSQKIAFDIEVGAQEDSNGLVDALYLVSKVLDGQYPNVRLVVPKQTVQRIKVERELFQECVSRAALVTTENHNSISLRISKNLLEIKAFSPEVGEAHESMAIGYEGPDVEVAFNPQFILDPLKSLTKDEIFFEFNDQYSPGVIKTLESFLCVIMPLRLN